MTTRNTLLFGAALAAATAAVAVDHARHPVPRAQAQTQSAPAVGAAPCAASAPCAAAAPRLAPPPPPAPRPVEPAKLAPPPPPAPLPKTTNG